MDDREADVVQKHFSYLVQQGQAEELLDELFTADVIDLDDYQRVDRQVTDSDKMRMLLTLLLKKVPRPETNTFGALLRAFRKANRADLADALTTYYRHHSVKRLKTTEGAGQKPLTSETSPKFLFLSGDGGATNDDRADGGMDVADCIPNTNSGEMTAETKLESPPQELSPPVSKVADKLTVSSKQLKQAIESAKGVSGQILMGGRVFNYLMTGDFKDGKVEWLVRVTDQTTLRCAERKSPDDRHELLEDCLKEFIK